MIQHEPFNNAGAEGGHFGISDGDARAFLGRRQAGHDDFAVRIVFVLELFDRTLTAGAHRPQRWMPAKIRQLEALRKITVEQVLIRVHLVRSVVNVDDSPYLSPRAAVLADVPFEIIAKMFQCALQRLGRTGASAQKVLPGLHILA